MRRTMSSLRAQVILGLSLTLVLATVVTVLIDQQITDRRLQQQAERLLAEELEVVAGLIADSRSSLLTALRNNAQNLQIQGASAPAAALRQQAAIIQRNLGTDGIAMIDDDGHRIVAVGLEPTDLPAPDPAQMLGNVQLVVTTDGRSAEVLSVRVRAGLVLVAVEALDDARAFELRRQLGGSDVVLLHDQRVAGSTVSDPAPVLRAAGEPPSATRLQLRGEPALAGYTPLPGGLTVAVVTPQLLTGLGNELARGRLLAFLGLLAVVLAVSNLLLRRITRPLVQLSETAEAVRGGAVDRSFEVGSQDEIGRLGATLEAMRRTLGNQLTVISMQADAIRTATQRIVSARDVERRRMAQDLHDGVQQQLVMLRLRIGMLEETTDAAEREALGRDVDHVIQRLRETGRAIYPSILADRGLSGAVWSLAASCPVPVDVDLRPDPLPRLDEAVEAGAYFIIAEATTNAMKHADPGRLAVRIRHRNGPGGRGSLLLVVRDDGSGFEVGPDVEGAGLQNLHDRATALGGVAHVRSIRGRGTSVVVRIPTGGTSVGGALEKEQHRGDAAVEVVGVAEAELAEDGVGVLLHRALADDQLFGDR
jgi:signal transduction histidine kinase